MTRKLEELFDLPPSGCTSETTEPATIPTTQIALQEIDATIDKIDQALPAVKGLDASDAEMDELASKAQETFDNLMDLGFNGRNHARPCAHRQNSQTQQKAQSG